MKLVHLLEGVVHDHDARRFRGHVAVLSNRHANRGGHHGRGVVDAVSHVEGFGLGSFGANEREFLFRTLFRVNFSDAHLLAR